MVGDDADRSTTTTRASRAIRRASVSAVRVMLSPAAVPRIVILRAASPAPRRDLGELLDFGELGQTSVRVSTGIISRIGFFARHRRIGFTDDRDRSVAATRRPPAGTAGAEPAATAMQTQPPHAARSCAAVRR